MKTVKQIADELGVSKQAIQKRLTREPLCTNIQPYIHTVDGTRYIDVDGENLIKSAFQKKDRQHVPGNVPSDVPSNVPSDVPGNVPSDVPGNVPGNQSANIPGDVYIVLKDTIDMLKRQLEIKDAQILSLTEINRNLSESINADRRNDLAETFLDGNKLIGEGDKPKKRGFFKKLFNKDTENG
jgi:hypothetical protein